MPLGTSYNQKKLDDSIEILESLAFLIPPYLTRKCSLAVLTTSMGSRGSEVLNHREAEDGLSMLMLLVQVLGIKT